MKTQSLFQYLKSSYPEIDPKELYARILCGEVRVSGGVVKDPKFQVKSSVVPEFSVKRFVSRGGEKLDYALGSWPVEVRGLTVLDGGASTGGFTDALLQRGAERVYSVDVGYNQLDYKLRQDRRVVVMERTNVMALTPDNLNPAPDFAVADLSFRSICRAATVLVKLTKQKRLIALVKPQFEIEDEDDSFDGIIRDDDVLVRVTSRVIRKLAQESLEVVRMALSPIKGGSGNREFLFDLRYKESAAVSADIADQLWSLLRT